jgi:hypothetical protein
MKLMHLVSAISVPVVEGASDIDFGRIDICISSGTTARA